MKSYHRYTIEGWMLTELGLDGSELILYAILYQLTKHEPKRWNYTHLAKYTGIGYYSVRRFVKDLRERGLLFVEKKSNESFIFRAVHHVGIVVDAAILADEYLPLPAIVQNDQQDMQIAQQDMQIAQQDMQIAQQDMQIAEKESTKEKDKKISTKSCVCSKDGTFDHGTTHTSVDWAEILAYARSRNVAQEVAEKFYSYYSANGWMIGQNPVKNWRAAFNMWVKFPKTPSSTNQATPEDYKARAEYLRQQSILEDQRREQEIAEARTPEARAAAEEFFKKFNNSNNTTS